jgi:hypothetical protein
MSSLVFILIEAKLGLEPRTFSLQKSYSTLELQCLLNGAGRRILTAVENKSLLITSEVQSDAMRYQHNIFELRTELESASPLYERGASPSMLTKLFNWSGNLSITTKKVRWC